MRLLQSLTSVWLFAVLSTVLAASSWSFDDATVSVQAKGAGVGEAVKEKLDHRKPLSKPVTFGPTDTLKIVLTTTNNKKPERPHQAFLTLSAQDSGLQDSFPFSVKESGKGKVELTQKDLPNQLLASSKPLKASFIIGSFGSATPLKTQVFELSIERDPQAAPPSSEAPTRYGPREEIHHIFRADPTSPPKLLTLIFLAAVVAALPLLGAVWALLGANLNHASKAFSSASVSHVLFFGSIVALECIFFMYYTVWNLFQTLPAAALAGAVAFLSGSRALTEVQERRLAGLR